MLNQYVSMDAPGRADPRGRALVEYPQASARATADPILSARLSRVAAASGHSPPRMVPSAAVLLLPLHLPLKTTRKRLAALPFVIEPFLAQPLEELQVALGPNIEGDTWLCAAMDRDLLAELGDTADPILPDILGVPIPTDPATWTIWCATETIHIRLADCGGMSVRRDGFADLWRAQQRPELTLAFGAPPPGVRIAHILENPPDPDLSGLALNLNPVRSALARQWRGRLAFAACAAGIALVAQATLATLDARALAKLSAERSAALSEQLIARGVPGDLGLPARAIARTLTATGATQTQDAFLDLLARVGEALPGNVEMRDLRFDGTANSLSTLITGGDLSALQRAEAKLKASGLAITSGSATQTDAAAQMQLVVSGSS